MMMITIVVVAVRTVGIGDECLVGMVVAVW